MYIVLPNAVHRPYPKNVQPEGSTPAYSVSVVPPIVLITPVQTLPSARTYMSSHRIAVTLPKQGKRQNLMKIEFISSTARFPAQQFSMQSCTHAWGEDTFQETDEVRCSNYLVDVGVLLWAERYASLKVSSGAVVVWISCRCSWVRSCRCSIRWSCRWWSSRWHGSRVWADIVHVK